MACRMVERSFEAVVAGWFPATRAPSLGLLIGSLLFCTGPCVAQTLPPLRSVYTHGLNVTNAGVLPDTGLTYSNTFMDYSFHRLKCSGCGLATDVSVSVFIDLNLFVFVSNKTILGGTFAALTALSVSSSAISLPRPAEVSQGNGFADTFVQPFTLGWKLKRADISAAYALFAPTGRFRPGATDNTGAGYWSNCPTAGETVYLTANKTTAFSAYQIYEFHTTQRGTHIHPGQAFSLDYSLTQVLPITKKRSTLLQAGVAGYGMWQTTDNSGPGINAAIPGHYVANSVGGVVNVVLPMRKTSLGIKLLKEYANSNTVQGGTLQITGATTF
jgi:hypothetical protein